ncbi:MAG: type 4a pilus biogenesis protein PilO [Terriglobia bacterium]|jgi:type IV pilus assembly protein PilO
MPKSFNDLPAAVQIAIIVLIVVLLGGAVSYFYVLPLKDKRDSLRKEVDRLTAENKLNQIFERERTQYLNRIAQLEKQLAMLRSIVPEEQATDDFMRMVFEDGRATEVNIRTFVPQAVAPKDIYTEMPFKLRLDGTYYALLAFFNRLAHEQRIVSVSGLSLGSPEGGGMGAFKLHPGETVGANCVLTTYFSRVSTAAPTTPKK